MKAAADAPQASQVGARDSRNKREVGIQDCGRRGFGSRARQIRVRRGDRCSRFGGDEKRSGY
jgi:hypothetical protein